MARDAFLSTLEEEEERKTSEDGRRKVAFASPRAKRFVPSVLGAREWWMGAIRMKSGQQPLLGKGARGPPPRRNLDETRDRGGNRAVIKRETRDSSINLSIFGQFPFASQKIAVTEKKFFLARFSSIET